MFLPPKKIGKLTSQYEMCSGLTFLLLIPGYALVHAPVLPSNVPEIVIKVSNTRVLLLTSRNMMIMVAMHDHFYHHHLLSVSTSMHQHLADLMTRVEVPGVTLWLGRTNSPFRSQVVLRMSICMDMFCMYMCVNIILEISRISDISHHKYITSRHKICFHTLIYWICLTQENV